MTVKLTVMVWGKECEISVYQRSKTVWIASGDYMGEYLEAKDSSQSTAMKRWAEAAKYKGG